MILNFAISDIPITDLVAFEWMYCVNVGGVTHTN